MSKDYSQLTLEEQLAVAKDYLPSLPLVLDELKKFNEREEKLEIEHKVDIDISDVGGEVSIKNSLDVNDLPEMHQSIKNLIQTLEDKDTAPKVTVKQEKSIVDLKNVEKLLTKLVAKDVSVNVKKDTVKLPSTAREAVPVRLSNGKSFYEAMFSGGGGIGQLSQLTITESTSTPGVFGLVMLNPDGSNISAGGGGTTPTASTYGNGTYENATYA